MLRAAWWPILTVRSLPPLPPLPPLPRIRTSRACRSRSLRAGSSGSWRMAAISDSRMPVARNTAMTAASRRCAKVLPRHASSSFDSSTLVKTGTAFASARGARIAAIGSGRPSSSASHLKNCRRARNWMPA